MENIRSFIAVELSNEIKASIKDAYKELSPINTFVKLTKPENIHITLKFFSAFSINRLPLLFNVLEEVCNNFHPFIMEISKIGAFPNLKHPRILWMDIVQGGEELKNIQYELEDIIEQEHLWEKEERAFKPHITIGRIKNNKGIEKYINKINFDNSKFLNIGSQLIDSIKLIKSELTSKGPIYTELKKINF